jgi:Fe-S cluster assembly iron-binding protein IscA
MEIRKAQRQKAKLRIGVSGPAGSGKSYSAILIANGIASEKSKVGIIDTENGSADLYADLGDFSVIRLEAPYTPERYIEAIKAFESAGMEVCIIDSVTHEWDGKGGLLESNELIAQTKFKGNTWAAWSATTPRHQKFIEAITTSKMHVITSARSKTDTIQTEDKKIKKVGLKEIQREGFEYELTLNFTIDRDGHYATASKDRTKLFIDKDPFVISEETGRKLKEWAETGADRPPEPLRPDPKIASAAQKTKIMHLAKMIGLNTTDKEALVKGILTITKLEIKDENLSEIVSRMEEVVKEQKEAQLDPLPADPEPDLI